ncbi:MAG: hypothetical protein VXC58_14780 [Deltaproteobacteria bacterium]
MASKRDLNRIKELKVEIPYYGELSTSESKEKESYKKLVVELKKELEFLKRKLGRRRLERIFVRIKLMIRQFKSPVTLFRQYVI